MVLGAVAGRKAIISGGHIRVADQPTGEVRRSPRVLVTAPGRRGVQRIVVAVVVVHDRVVSEARDKAHGATRRHTLTRTHAGTHAHTQILLGCCSCRLSFNV